MNQEWRSVAKVREEVSRYRRTQPQCWNKREVSVTLPLTDFEGAQKASEGGMPYQALIADIVHRFVTGNMTEQLAHPEEADRGVFGVS